MPNTQMFILSLILLFITFTILLVAFIILYNKYITRKISSSINNECNNYKDAIEEQYNILTKQLLKQISEQDIVINNKPEAGKNLMNIFIKLREAIKESCVDSMNQIGAARIAVYLFHNGIRSTHGISFFKMSCICEKVAIGSGIRERMIEQTGIPVNLFDEMVDKLITYNRYIIMNNDGTQETHRKIFISADKINYTQLIALYDINNNMLGFVAAEMDKPYSKDEADREKEVLDELVKQLVPVLSYSDYISVKIQ